MSEGTETPPATRVAAIGELCRAGKRDLDLEPEANNDTFASPLAATVRSAAGSRELSAAHWAELRRFLPRQSQNGRSRVAFECDLPALGDLDGSQGPEHAC